MEAFKISIEVSVNLSENTQNFIKSMFMPMHGCCISSPIAVDNFDPSQEDFSQVDKQPAQSVKPATTAQPTQAKPATPVVDSAPTPVASSQSKSIEDVRAMLAKKVNEHRDSIKQKLNDLGAPSVTKLDPSKYDEMYNFLASL